MFGHSCLFNENCPILDLVDSVFGIVDFGDPSYQLELSEPLTAENVYKLEVFEQLISGAVYWY